MIKARRIVAAMAAAACILSPPIMSAANPVDIEAAASRLHKLKSGIKSAREEQRKLEAETAALAEELHEVRVEAATAAEAVEARAADVATLERQMWRLTQREIELTATLGARREQISETLMALQRLARLPPVAVLVHPDTPLDLLKVGMILGTAVEEIERRAQSLRQDLLDLDEARRTIENRRRTLDRAVVQLRQESGQLDRLIAKKSGLQAQLASRAWDVAERAKRLAGQAGEAEVLVSRLRQEEQMRQALATAIARHSPPRPPLRPAPNIRPESELQPKSEVRSEPELRRQADRGGPSQRDPSQRDPSQRDPSQRESGRTPARSTAGHTAGGPAAEGSFHPADGRIVAGFGESRGDSGASKGVTWETLSGAKVVAPAAGTVAFAGPFRGYGLLLIVEHLDGYHSLLAGLEQIDVGIGQRVRSGDLLGTMGHRSTGNLSLYMELRKNGHPVNPLPWLAAGKRKVSG